MKWKSGTRVTMSLRADDLRDFTSLGRSILARRVCGVSRAKREDISLFILLSSYKDTTKHVRGGKLPYQSRIPRFLLQQLLRKEKAPLGGEGGGVVVTVTCYTIQ